MTHTLTSTRRLALVLALVLPFALTACDSTDPGGNGGGGDDTFFLPAQSVEFDFSFDGGNLQADVFNDVESDNTENLIAFIESRGFSVDDVVGVAIQGNSAELRIAQPPLDAGVNGFDRVQVRLRTEGASAAGALVISGSDFAGNEDDTVDLDVDSGDFTLTVQTGAFEALLQVDPSNMILDQNYVVEVSFNVVIEVEAPAARPETPTNTF